MRQLKARPFKPSPVKPPHISIDLSVLASLGLSPRQAQIVELLLQSKRDKDIAEALGMSVPTVRTHLTRIFEALGARDRMEVVLRVVEQTLACTSVNRQHKS